MQILEYTIIAVVAAFLAFMTYRGCKNGLIKVVYSIAAIVVSMTISIWLTQPVTTFLKENTPVYDAIKEQTDKYVDKNLKEQNFFQEISNTTEDVQKDTMEALSIPAALTSIIVDDKVAEKKLSDGTEMFCEYISSTLADLCMKVCVTVTVMIILVLILRVLSVVLDIFARLPVVSQVNKMVGGVVGFVQGILIVWVACLVLMALAGTPTGAMVMKTVKQSEVLSFIFNNNIFLIVFKNVVK